jgi:hypothetical protein
MTSKRGSYPYPLLDAGDDVDSNFVISNVIWTASVRSLGVEFRLLLTDDDLWSYIESGAARIVVRWRCAQTFKLGQAVPRETVAFGRARDYVFELAQDDIIGRLQFEVQIVATRAIPQYQLKAQSPDYGDISFSIGEGDLLALGGSAELLPGKAFDPMRPPLDSCFRIVEEHSLKFGIFVDWENDDYVDVKVASATFQHFSALVGQPKLQLAVVMVPALMATLAYLADANNALALDSAWGRSITSLCKGRGLVGKTPLEQVQALLEDPIGQAMAAEVDRADE